MKNFKYVFYILFLLMLFISIGPINTIIPVDNIFESELEIILNTIDTDYDIPQVSSPVSNLPWRNHRDFLDTKDKYHTPILMSAFCAVLKNPLPGESYNVSLASNNMKGLVLKPSEIFSMNNLIGPYNKSNGYKEGASYSDGNIVMTEGGGVCKIATTTYNLAILSNLDIIERHYHSMPINYVPYGQDATVSYGGKDFRFKNITEHNILIWSEMIDNRLYMGFYSRDKPPEVTWNHETSSTTEPPIKYVKNTNLNKGEMNIITKGLKGASIKSSISIKYPDGRIKIKNMGISNYMPLPKVIEIN